jgi:glutamate/aspartate transport system substrate-binding protein
MEKQMRVKHLPLLAAAFALLAGPALAQTDTLKKIKDSGTITIGHRESSLPFSYYDDKQQVVGYAMDLCMRVVDAVKAELKMPDLKVALNPVTSATRIPLIANGTVDMECGSTTNNLERQKQVSFSITYFVTQSRILSKKADGINSLADLKGKQVVSTSGTTSLKLLNERNTAENLGMTILPAKDHAEAFLMVETGRAAAFVMDDILLASLAANSKSPADYVITGDALSVEPYGIMLPLGDAAFKKVVDDEMKKIYSSGDIKGIYDKWFMQPIPPKGIVLNVPLSPIFQRVIDNPTDSGDPADYKK